MTAVLLRLCEEDREKFAKPDWPEWIRFDEDALDDLDLVTLNQWESELNVSFDFLLLVDKPSRTVRWKAACVWMGLQLAGHKVPALEKFNIKPRKIAIKDEETAEPKSSRRRAKAADADPPSSSPSSEDEASETVSA